MNSIKRNILLLCLVCAIIIISYQLFLNLKVVIHKQVDFHDIKHDKHEVVVFEDEHSHNEDDTLAQKLNKEIKVLCWVMTSPDNHQTKAIHVMATWGKRCNKLLFATESSLNSEGLPVVIINTTKGREHLTAKTMQAFDYIYKTYVNDFDWFLKCDDDTYVVVENLRYFLSSKDPHDAVYFGHKFQKFMSQGYYSGGGGYVLSKKALELFGRRPPHTCSSDNGAEDVEIGRCMVSLHVKTGDSRDVLGRSRFHCFTPLLHIVGNFPDWYYTYDAHGAKKGIASLSDYAITFHYVDPQTMYVFDYFLYHLRPYGILNKPQELNIMENSLSTTLGTPLTLDVKRQNPSRNATTLVHLKKPITSSNVKTGSITTHSNISTPNGKNTIATKANSNANRNTINKNMKPNVNTLEKTAKKDNKNSNEKNFNSNGTTTKRKKKKRSTTLPPNI